MEQVENLKRGDVFMANLGYQRGNVQGGIRPVVVIQNDIGNKNSPTIVVVPLTTKRKDSFYPFHVKLRKELSELEEDSVVLCEQPRTIDKTDILEYVTALCHKEIVKINTALRKELCL